MRLGNVFSNRGLRTLTVGMLGICLCSVAGRVAWADKDEHEDHQKHKKTEVHVALPSIRVDVNPSQPPPPVVAVPADSAFVVQARGPVHEAFDEPVIFDPLPGIIVPQPPPQPLDEVPPNMAPVGNDVEWIPGYWALDEERSSFIWISGIWRNMPPGQQFVPGYWREVAGGYQWVSGFWQSENVQDVQYLPPPPQSIEAEPTMAPTIAGNIWVPGVWLWRDTGYMWRPGYWMASNANWVWVPDHYTWAPAGFVFVKGYWDHSMPRRGVLFAPVYFPQAMTAHQRIVYTPSVVVNATLLSGGLFARPSYSHYYFGDYYDRSYFKHGIYPAYSFHGSRYGYDPTFAHYVAFQRTSRPEVISRLRDDYRYRRDHSDARPPHTYNELRQVAGRRDVNPRLTSMLNMVQPLSRVAEAKNLPMQFHTLQQDRIGTYRQTISKTRQYQDERRKVEAQRTTAAPPQRSVTRTNDTPRTVSPVTPALPAKPQPASPGVSTPRRSEGVQRVQPGKPAAEVRRQDQPTQLRLQRSPLAGRPLNKVERSAAPPSAPKAAASENKGRSKTPPPVKRSEPKD